MPTNSGQPDNPQRIYLVCECGKKLVAHPTHSGKRLKCPACGHVVGVPSVGAGIAPTPAKATSAPHAKKRERRFTGMLLMIGLWSLPVAVAVGGGAYIHFEGKWRQQARIDAANTEKREAVKGAGGSLKQGSAKGGNTVEPHVKKAMAANDGSQKPHADADHEAVVTRRDELADDALFAAAKAKFDAVRFDSAYAKFDATQFSEVAALLQRYISGPVATKKAEAKQLLADYELAISDKAALQTLMAMSEQQFAQFTSTGVLNDYKIRDVKIVYLRSSTLRRNLETAKRRREEIKLAEANHQQEEARIAEANRQESERLARAAADESKLPGVWRHKAGDGEPGEITLHSNGKINNPDGQDTWTFTGRTLVLRWANRHAPGGFWIDTCIVSDDRKNYRGSNQHKALIAGWKVDPALAAAAKKDAEAAKKRPTEELIREKLVGNWSWGKGLDQRIQFDSDGTYRESKSRWHRDGEKLQDGHWEPMPKGQWKLEKDGTIGLSASPPDELMFVKMNLNEDKISIEYRYPKRHEAYNVNVVASRFNDTSETDRYVAQQIEVLKSGRPVAAADADAAQKPPARKGKKRVKMHPPPKGKGSVVLRRQAADNLKALGEAANAAVFALAEVASSDSDTLLQRKAIEALGEMGRCAGIRTLVPTLLHTRDPEMAVAAEDSLMKLLPATGGRLGIEDAIRLLEARKSGNERVAPVIESAWAASGFSEGAVLDELNKRAAQKQREEAYWAKAREERARREADPAWQQWKQAQREHDQAAARAAASYNQYEESRPKRQTSSPRQPTAAEETRKQQEDLFRSSGGRMGTSPGFK
jgi:hypothetical protein